jgi:hypothetical protein
MLQELKILGDEPSPDDLQLLDEQINEHNMMRTGRRDYRPVSVFLRDDLCVADWAMYLGMLGFILLRRNDHHHAAMHQHSEPHSTSHPAHNRRFHFRPILLAVAYFTAVVLVPGGVAIFNIGSKFSAQQGIPAQVPAIADPLPPLPVPDPAKKIAVVLSSAYGGEITDTLPNFEILADSGVFNMYSVAPERTPLPLVSQTLRPTGLDFIPHFSYAEYASQIGRGP